MNYQTAKIMQAHAEARMQAAKAALSQYPKHENGLTPDAVKFSPEYCADKAEAGAAFKALQDINAFIVRNFKKEERAARQANRASKTTFLKETP